MGVPSPHFRKRTTAPTLRSGRTARCWGTGLSLCRREPVRYGCCYRLMGKTGPSGQGGGSGAACVAVVVLRRHFVDQRAVNR